MNVHDDELTVVANSALVEEMPESEVSDGMLNSTNDLMTAGEEMTNLSRDVEDLGGAHASVESFTRAFFDTVSLENWDRKVATQYQLGISNIFAGMGINVKLVDACASFEAAGVSQSFEDNRKESEVKRKSLLARIWAAVKEAIAKTIAALSNYINNIGTSAKSLLKASRSLYARIKVMQDDSRRDEYFDPAPRWAKYLHTTQAELSPIQALETARSLQVSVGTNWLKQYEAAVDKVSKMIEAHRPGMPPIEPNVTWQPQVFEQEAGDYPGMFTLHFNNPQSSNPNKLEQMAAASLTTTRSSEKIKGKVKALSASEIYEVAQRIEKLSVAMTAAESNLRLGLGHIRICLRTCELKYNRDEFDKAGIALLTRMISRVGQGARAAMPIIGNVAMGAYNHASASLNLYK